MYVHFKPRLWCLFLHQAAWDLVKDDEDIWTCPYCKIAFVYPTKKEHNPVYRKDFEE